MIPAFEEEAISRFAALLERAEIARPRYQTGIREASSAPKGKGCRSLDTPCDLQFLSLRGLDLNQRPLGYEARTGSADAYPLVTGGVRCPEITSDHLSQPQFSHKNSVSCPRASRPQIGLIHCETETFRTLRPWAAAFT